MPRHKNLLKKGIYQNILINTCKTGLRKPYKSRAAELRGENEVKLERALTQYRSPIWEVGFCCENEVKLERALTRLPNKEVLFSLFCENEVKLERALTHFFWSDDEQLAYFVKMK